MAYLNFTEAGFANAVRSGQVAAHDVAVQDEDTRFSALEWLVIALAERDRLGSLRRPGRFAKAMSVLFGKAEARPLARPRLEALRRLAVLAWHHGSAVPAAEVEAFRAAGFSGDQAALLLANVASRRAGGRA